MNTILNTRELQDALHESNVERQRLEAELKAMDNTLRTKESALVQLSKDKTQLGERTLQFEAEVNSLKERLRAHEDEKKALGAEKTQIEAQLRKFERQQRSEESANQLELNYQVEKLQNENALLLKKQEELKEETKTLYRFQELKTQAIEKLTARIREYGDLEEKHKDMELHYRALQALVPDHERHIEQLKAIQKQKDEEIEKLLKEAREDSSLNALQTEKRVLQSELKRSQEIRAQQDRTIRAQQLRVDRLLARLETLASCSGGQKKKPRSERQADLGDIDVQGVSEENVKREEREELVPVKLYNTLQDEVRHLQQGILEKEDLIREKDAAIEHLERKVSIITKAKVSDARVAQNAYKELESEYEALREEMEVKELKFKELEASLRREVHRAKAAARRTAADLPMDPMMANARRSQPQAADNGPQSRYMRPTSSSSQKGGPAAPAAAAAGGAPSR